MRIWSGRALVTWTSTWRRVLMHGFFHEFATSSRGDRSSYHRETSGRPLKKTTSGRETTNAGNISSDNGCRGRGDG